MHLSHVISAQGVYYWVRNWDTITLTYTYLVLSNFVNNESGILFVIADDWLNFDIK